ncbi:MAG: virulence RhuM family protein [Prevotellaceae bacterium]|nr:virulence RhuM family protein [Prevotellaceae bacterium]
MALPEKEAIKVRHSDFVIYEADDKVTKVAVRLEEETVWLTQAHLVELFQSSKANISEHIKHIFEEGELNENSAVRKFRTTASDGKNYEIAHYNLDMIISLGYRINSKIATKFRQWATERLKEYIVKGFTLDDERLKNGGGRYFRELLQRIRDIRSSERNLWQQVTDIYATSIDYDPRSAITADFFATVQNKMHYAVHRQTAAEVVYNRVDNEKIMLGMTNFKGNYITKEDVRIAKNYLSEIELQKLNLLTEGFLGYAELQALEQKPMRMNDWKNFLDGQLRTLNKDILTDKGKISHKQAIKKAEKEFEIYRQREMCLLESDFDRAVKQLTNKNNEGQ